MLFFWFSLVFMCGISRLVYRKFRVNKISSQARRDLFKKIWEMFDDPFTMESDWREILSICRSHDEWFTQTNPYFSNFEKTEDLVRRLMG